MTRLNEVHKCETCGNIVEILHTGAGDLYCCDRVMELKKENFEEAAIEKHIPVIKDNEKGKKITVGEVEHPMSDEHYIEWIEVLFKDGKVLRKDLKPGDDPSIYCRQDHDENIIRAYCNVHGLWIKK